MKRSTSVWCVPVVLALAALAALAPGDQALAQANQRCFPETGQCISGRFRQFWEQNGGLRVFGFPTGPQQELQVEGKPLQSQQFERTRLELHPENARPYDVLLGRLGADRLAQQSRDPFTFPKSAAQSGCRYFPETQHNVCGDMLKAWRASGLEFDGNARAKSEAENLGLFGLPLSDSMVETLSDGKQYTVQWFERARFELHPENAPPYTVLLGLLGNEIRAGAQPAPAPADQCADIPEPVSARLGPGKCLKPGDAITIDIFGFQPNERVGFWLNAPDGSIYGDPENYDIGATGANQLSLTLSRNIPPGVWSFVFQGTTSKHQSIVYFRILKP